MENDELVTLVQKMQQGDQEAFGQIFEQFKDEALRMAYMITGNRASSEDIVQEAFIQCYLKIDMLNDPTRFKAWFLKSLTRMAWRANTKEKKQLPVANIADEVDKQWAVEENFGALLEMKPLYEAVQELELKQKTAIILYYFNEFSVKDTAQAMGCFEGTIKSRLHAARKNLLQTLSPEDFNDKNDKLIKQSKIFGKAKATR